MDARSVFANMLEVGVRRAVTDFVRLYYYLDWQYCGNYIAFERLICHSQVRMDSLFTVWHNVEIFSISRRHIFFLYQLLPA